MADSLGFSLQRVALLVLAAIVLAGGPFFVNAFGWPIVGLILLMCLVYGVSTTLLIGALFGRGSLRVFCIGALAPIAIQFVSGSMNYFLKAPDWDAALDRGVINGALETLGILSLAMGVLAVGVHKLIGRFQSAGE